MTTVARNLLRAEIALESSRFSFLLRLPLSAISETIRVAVGA